MLSGSAAGRSLVLAAALATGWGLHAQAQSPSTKPVENRGNAAVAGAPGVLAPPSTGAQSDLCLGLGSLAYGSPVMGLTIDFNRADKACTSIRQSIRLQQLGYPEAATQLMCESGKVRAAMARAGTPCEGVRH